MGLFRTHQQSPASSQSGVRILGIAVRAHWSTALFGLFVAWNLVFLLIPQFVEESSALARAVVGVLGAAGLAGSIVAHEFGHALRARHHGVDTESITLWILGGVARLRTEPQTPRAAAEIAVAGPIVSVVLGLAFGVMAVALGLVSQLPLVVVMLAYLALANLGLAIFNMIPALPLDGGRALHAWTWHRNGDREKATISAAVWGRRFGMGMVGFGVLQLLAGGFGFFSILLGAFLMGQAKAEDRRARQIIALRSRPNPGSMGEAFGRAVAALLGGRTDAEAGPAGPTHLPLVGAHADDQSVIDVQLVRQD